jgi:hypothetical protein
VPVSSGGHQGLGWEADAAAGTSSPGGTRIPPARWHLTEELAQIRSVR